MSLIVKLDTRSPDEQILRQAVDFLREGKTVAFPTETFYALGVSAFHEEAVRKVFTIKGRTFDKPLPLIIHRDSMLEAVARQIPECARVLIHHFWPGPLTLIFKASEKISPLLSAHTYTVAVRESSHPLAHLLVTGAQVPITATSANNSEYPACSSAGEVEQQLGCTIDLIIDGGKTEGLLPSTIVDMTLTPPRVVREGAIPPERLHPFWE